MAACGSLQHIFETPLPETPTALLDSFSSWNQINPLNSSNIHHENSSFTEIFGELHFKEKLENETEHVEAELSNGNKNEEIMKMNFQKSPSKESFPSTPGSSDSNYNKSHKSSDSFSSMNSDSLQLCTEGLGFESSDEVEDLIKSKDNDQDNWKINNEEQEGKVSFTKQYFPMSEMNCCGSEFRRSPRTSVGGFPPPISCIGKSGKPWVCFKSYRHDGRFVLKEIRIPTQEFLHAYREDGRLKLQFVMPDDEIRGEEDEEDDLLDDDEEGEIEEDGEDAISEGKEAKTTHEVI